MNVQLLLIHKMMPTKSIRKTILNTYHCLSVTLNSMLKMVLLVKWAQCERGLMFHVLNVRCNEDDDGFNKRKEKEGRIWTRDVFHLLFPMNKCVRACVFVCMVCVCWPCLCAPCMCVSLRVWYGVADRVRRDALLRNSFDFSKHCSMYTRTTFVACLTAAQACKRTFFFFFWGVFLSVNNVPFQN